MKKELIALFCIFLFVSSTLAFAEDSKTVVDQLEPKFKNINTQEFDERETGESIIVEVKSYEPRTLVASAVEQDDVPVFVFLAGSTLGSLTGPESIISGRFTTVKDGEVFYGVPPVKAVSIRDKDFDSKFIKSITYRPPKKGYYSLDNLGYLIVNLKKIPKEANVPDVIDANITARIEFDMEHGFGIGRQTLVLDEESNEKSFMNKPDISSNSVFSGNAYVRTSKIDDVSANFVVYDTAFRNIGSRTLRVGETSSPITLSELGSDFVQNRFRLQLDSVLDPQREYAEVEVSIDGSLPEKRVLYKGSSLYPGSTFKVSDISKISQGAETKESLRLSGPSGTQMINRNYTRTSNVLSAKLTKQFFDDLNEDSKRSLNKDKGGYRKDDSLSLLFYVPNFDFGDVKKSLGVMDVKFDDSVKDLKFDRNYFPRRDKNNIVDLISDLGLSTSVNVENNVATIKLSKIPEKQVADVCLSQDIIYSQSSYFDESVLNKLKEFAKDSSLSNSERKRLLCSSIEIFKKVSSSYPDELDDSKVSYRSKSDYMIAKSYDELAKLSDVVKPDDALKLALDYYKRAQNDGLSSEDVQQRVSYISTVLVGGVDYHDVVVDDSTREVSVRLLRVVGKGDTRLDSRARVSVNNAKEYFVGIGDPLFLGSDKSMDSCRVKEISRERIVVSGCPDYGKDNKLLSNASISDLGLLSDITLRENVPTTINKFKVVLLGTELHKQAAVTVLPGSGKSSFSESSFLLHIPVEKRAVKFNPDKIEDKIKSTEEKIKKLNKIINDLDKLVKSWKGVCLATFAYLTIKNSFGVFGGGGSRVKAREKVMVEDGWRKYCESDSGSGKTYKSYDDCIFEHADKINQNIDVVQKAFESADSKFKKGTDKLGDTSIKGVRDFEKASGEEIYSEQEFKDLVYLGELNSACKDSNSFGADAKGKPYPNSCADVSSKYSSKLFEMQRADVYFSGASSDFKKKSLDSYDVWHKANPQKSLSDFNNERSAEVSRLKVASEFNIFMDKNLKSYSDKNTPLSAEILTVKPKDKNAKEEYYWETPHGTVQVEKSGDLYAYTTPGGDGLKLKPTPKTDDVVKVSNVVWDVSAGRKSGVAYNPGGVSYKVVADSKGRPVIDDGPFKGKVATTNAEVAMGDVVGSRSSYGAGATYECYEDGKPYCVPLSKGNFVKVLEFYKDGSPKTMNIWNVGSDGNLCTSDDVPAAGDSKYGVCAHTSSLMSNKDCSRVLSEAQSKVNSAFKYCKSKTPFTSDGHKFKHSVSAAAQESYSKAGHCEDAMEINDCKLMFAVCDPVMCPPSRFNLAGNWQVADVVKTGIVGSVVLGLPNFPTTPVPICLTGVSAGLKNIRSILEAYKGCLTTMKVEGKSIGVCDKIRSVYICQVLWQEAIAIFKVKGGLIDVVGKMFGNSAGGGEYFGFSDNFANVEKSVDYFTQSYATSVFAAHKGKSLEEAGTEICRSAAFGKVPGMGDYFDKLTEPENPSQFTALFDEMPYSETAKKSQYSVYYHIYAGTDSDREVEYSVFLRSPANRKFYVTEDCERRNKRIAKGSFADFSITCVADIGYTEICVDINGKQDCGFGKVSSAFSLNYLNDLVVKDEAARKITKVEECVPESPRTSPSLSSVALPGQLSLLRTGIIRVCSFDNPGKGANYKNWKEVGTCIDKDSKSWGSCWMDMSSVDVKSVSERADLKKELTERGIEISAEKKGIPESALLKEDASREKIDAAQALMQPKTWSAYVSSLPLLQEVVDLSIDSNSITSALYKIGVVYYELATTKIDSGELGRISDVKSQDIPSGAPKSESESDCSNGLDDDGDGLIDCADDDCNNQKCKYVKSENIGVGEDPIFGEGACSKSKSSCCVCANGPCCDGCNFKPSTDVCESKDKFTCKITPDSIFKITTYKFCTGTSKSCDGKDEISEPQLFKTCDVGEGCVEGESSCYNKVPT